MLCRISSRTRLSQPGRADSGRFLQTSQTEEERAEDECERVRATPLRLNRPASIYDEASSDDRRDQRLPSIRMFVSKDNDEPAVMGQSGGYTTEKLRYMPSS